MPKRRPTGTRTEAATTSTAAWWLATHLAEADVHEPALLVDDGAQVVDRTEHPHDLQLLLVQRVALERALDGGRVLHEAGGVEGPDRGVVGDAGSDHLPAARPAGHEVRLDQPGDDLEVGVGEAAVERDRRAPGGGDPQGPVGGVVARVVVLHAHVLEHPGVADQLGQLVTQVGPVQAGGHQDGDGGERDPCGDDRLDQRPQEQPVRHRAGDVADEDADAPPTPGQLGKRWGPHRMGQRVADRSLGIPQRRQRSLSDDGRLAAGRQGHLEPPAAVGQGDLLPDHGRGAGHRFSSRRSPGRARDPVIVRPAATGLEASPPPAQRGWSMPRGSRSGGQPRWCSAMAKAYRSVIPAT